MRQVIRPTVDGMAAEGRPYRGVLYAGLMVKDGQVKTLEFNARFGDPECQPLLMRMKSDIVPILMAVAEGDLGTLSTRLARQGGRLRRHGGRRIPRRCPQRRPDLGAWNRLPSCRTSMYSTPERPPWAATASPTADACLGVTALGSTVSEAIEKAYQGTCGDHLAGCTVPQGYRHKAIGRI